MSFLLMVNSNPGPISSRFRVMVSYILKLSVKNCGQTAADGDMVTIDSLYEVASALSIMPSPTLNDLPFSHNTARLAYHSAL